MDEPERSMVEVREELMVSPTDESQNPNPCSRIAHFLKPVLASDDNQLPKLPSQCLSSLVQSTPEPKNLPLSISFHGWRCRAKNWSTWIDKMAALHEATWKKAGIYEAIMNSTYQIKRNNDLVFGLAEKWCCETKSFVFSWGEASVTLEDVMILGGFSVLGSPVFNPLETDELKEVEEGLKNARLEIVRSKAKKACPRLWMQKFMDSGNEFEHEAFLAFWLSRYVFTNAHETIREHVFSVAIHLARGTKLALAPAVLASIYRDLCLLKDAITASTKLGKEEVFTLTLWSPFQLVQVWAWERFLGLRPQPNPIAKGEPRLVQWHDVSCKVDNVRLALESAGGSFEWRPYAMQVDNWKQPKFYRENEVCISITARLDKELESFARCLKASELVGLDCVEQYLPHRVAMQFGIDQDIPACVPPRSSETPELAWLNYCESLSGVKLYIPSRLYKAGVTAKYLKWWKQSVLECKSAAKGLKKSSKNPKGKKQGGKSASGCPGLHQKIDNFHGKTEVNDPSVSPNCSVKGSKKQGDSVKKNNIANGSRSCFPLKKSKSVSQILEEKQVGNNDSTSSGSNKRNSKKPAENLKGDKKGKEEESSPALALGITKESVQTLKRKEKDEKESASPGLSKKRLKRSAENTAEKDATPVSASSRFYLRSSKSSAKVKDKEEGSSDSASHPLTSVDTKKPPRNLKRKKGISSRVPASAPNFDGKEAEDSPEDNNPTLAEMMRSCKKRANTGTKDCEDDGNRSGHSQSLSSTIADDEVVKYLEPLAMLAEKAMQDESMLRGAGDNFEGTNKDQREQQKRLCRMNMQDESMLRGAGDDFEGTYKDQREQQTVDEKVVMEEPEKTVKDANESNLECPERKMISINGVAGECSCYAVEIPGLSLEERISRLEKLVEELKAMRSASK